MPSSLFVCLAFLAGALELDAAPWVVITEIHYHPAGGEDIEFIEILNREPPRVELGGWSLDGEVTIRFPDQVTLLHGERLVVARNPQALRRRYPDVGKVLGPFQGKLDNSGGRITLRNAAGARVCEVRYERDGRWPAPADGTGHTLSIQSPYFDPSRPESWTSSQVIGGTPGAPNAASSEVRGELLIKKGDEWKYLRGLSPPPPDWHLPQGEDSGWESGPSGFGYSDGDDATEFPDMRNNYASLYVRKTFELPELSDSDQFILRVDFDDGFVAYLNGEEVARANIGTPGQKVPFNGFADGNHEAGSPAEFALPGAGAGASSRSGRLRRGSNLLALEVHNNQLASSDLTLIVELERRPPEAAIRHAPPPLLNEVFRRREEASGETASFIELFNPGAERIDLDGCYLSDDPQDLTKLRLPRTIVEPRGFAVITARELGAGFSLGGAALRLTLTDPSASRVLDAIRLDLPETETGDAATARGRYPDGSMDLVALAAPSPGEPNRSRTTTDIVINEIMFNPITQSVDDEYVELYNRGSTTVHLAGYRLRGGVRYTFEAASRLAPGAYLVVARNPRALTAKYELPSEQVIGPFEGKLANQGEILTLRDSRGGVVDRVEFADRTPWPRWTDGLGSSLELRHPDLDNALAAAWAASDERAKATWQTFTYAKPHRPVMEAVSSRELQLMLLTEGECFIDEIRFGADTELVQDGDFEAGGRGWQALGTHERSHAVTARDTSGESYYHLIADGRGNPRNNYTALLLPRPLDWRKPYRLSFRARWQRGSPLLLTRVAGQSVAKLHRLEVPARLGTPGARNSVATSTPLPAVGTPEQHPVAPAAHEEVTLTVAVSSVAEVVEASVHFRREAAAAWQRAPLARAATGGRSPAARGHAERWSGAIPPLANGKVEFFIEAKDRAGNAGTFPRGAPEKRALYAVGNVPNQTLPSYTLLVADDEWRALRSRPVLSNRTATASLVFGTERIFHGVEVRPRGSPWTRRGRNNWRIVFGADNLDGRRSLTIDAQPRRDLAERLTFWLIDSLNAPSSRQQFVYFRIHGSEEGVYDDIEKIDASFLEDWYESGPGDDLEEREGGSAVRDAVRDADAATPSARLHKVDDYWELTLGGHRQYEQAYFRFVSNDPEDYRWNFPPRANSVDEDFRPLLGLIHFLDPRRTPDGEFFKNAARQLDVDEWIGILAARALVGDWDTIGGSRGKNAFVYLSPADRRWHLLPWDADLSWNRQYRGVSARRFPSIERLLDSPLHRRLFHGHLEYLVRRKLSQPYFDSILDDFRAHVGKSISRYARYAEQHRDVALRESPRQAGTQFAVRAVERLRGDDAPDRARVRGVAPIIVRRFRLDGIEGVVELEGTNDWTATFPVGPAGGELELLALDLGGNVEASSRIEVPPRAAAAPLPRRPLAVLSLGDTRNRSERAGPARAADTTPETAGRFPGRDVPPLRRAAEASRREPRDRRLSPPRSTRPRAVRERGSGSPRPRRERSAQSNMTRITVGVLATVALMAMLRLLWLRGQRRRELEEAGEPGEWVVLWEDETDERRRRRGPGKN